MAVEAGVVQVLEGVVQVLVELVQELEWVLVELVKDCQLEVVVQD